MNAAKFARMRAQIQRRSHGHRQRTRALAHLVRDARAALVVIDRKVVGYRLPNGEMVCIKHRYRTEQQAIADMYRIQAGNINGGRVPQRAYYCVHCSGFHLTSQTKAERFGTSE